MSKDLQTEILKLVDRYISWYQDSLDFEFSDELEVFFTKLEFTISDEIIKELKDFYSDMHIITACSLLFSYFRYFQNNVIEGDYNVQDVHKEKSFYILASDVIPVLMYKIILDSDLSDDEKVAISEQLNKVLKQGLLSFQEDFSVSDSYILQSLKQTHV